jgi:tetratricopeptide (TPR) repeat protein
MIVRDNETTIGPALQSISPWVDEIVVVDTGSKDRTPEICRQHGARLFAFPWCDDFSAARNESLKQARGEWVFWMDSDDTITAECGRKLRELANGTHPEDVLGYVMQVHCPGPSTDDGTPDVTIVDHVKLIRNRPDLRFEGRIHEQMLPAIRRAKGEVTWTDIYVVHSGSDHSPEGTERKLARDLRILHRELEESPQHPFVLFNLGMTYADAKRFAEAVDYLQRCIAISSPDESHVRKAYALLVSSLTQADRQDEAWKVCQRGRALYPDDKELLFRSAMLHHHFGRLTEAEQAYLEVLHGSEQRHFASVDRGLAGYKARHNLALVYAEMGRPDQAEREWCRILAEVPTYRPAWRGLTDAILKQGRIDDVTRLVQELRNKPGLRCESRLTQAILLEQAGRFSEARFELEMAERESPDDSEPLQRLCRLVFERISPAAAEASLRRLAQREPQDPAACHNLGSVCSQMGRFAEAVTWYQRSLLLRPGAESTRQQLQFAAAQLDRAVPVRQNPV